MANINLSWDNPTTGDDDIDYICVHRITGDQSATYDGAVSAADAATFSATAGVHINGSDPTYTYTSGLGKTFTDSTAAHGGTYTYGVFSKNGAGYGPGAAVTISV